MSIEKIHLWKLLRILYAPKSLRTTILRTGIREEKKEIARKRNGDEKPNGGDFHTAFWADAKQHVAGKLDLSDQTRVRAEKNKTRKRLYPLLAKGFLRWWNQKRRWKNEPFNFMPIQLKKHHEVGGVGVVKVENLLCLDVGGSSHRIVYPYFSEEPILSEEGARIALYVLGECFPSHPAEEMRVLDVLRGESYSREDVSLQGNEATLLADGYAAILKEWNILWDEYD